MKKKPNRRTPEEIAADRAVFDELERRARVLGAELEAAGSVYAREGRDDPLAYAVARISAELRPTQSDN
jgi:hypothetical protein